MFAVSLALIAQEFHGRDRATAFGVWGATIGGAVAIGPLVGGVITEHLGWQWIFFVNIPIGALAIALTETRLVNVAAQDAERIDVPGVLTFSGALFLLILGLIRGNPDGWGGWIIASLISSAVLLAVFVAIEARSDHPMLDLSLFRKPAFNGVSAVAFCLSASMFAMFLYLTLYIQGVLAYSPLDAGLRFLPLSVVSFFVAPIAARAAERVPVRLLLGAGLAIVGVGLLLIRGVSPDSSWTTLLAGFIVAGVGVGMTNPNIASVAVAVVPPQKAGMGAGINNTFRQIGIATGVAGLGAVFQSRIDSHLHELLPNVKPGVAELASSGGTQAVAEAIPNAPPQVLHASGLAFANAFNEIALIAALVAFAGAVTGFALTRSSDLTMPGAPPQAEEEEEAPAEPVPA
jgi:EmrB/QacA subfamily drug resistance transporter